jgi:Ca2+-binding EF-hand superfamily protein
LFRFERELKAKLIQKANNFNTEEATLLKAFKYFDLNNDGNQTYILSCLGTC